MQHTRVISISLIFLLCGVTFAQQSPYSPDLPTTSMLRNGYRGFADRMGAIDLGGELFDIDTAAGQLTIAPRNSRNESAVQDGAIVIGRDRAETGPSFRGELAELGIADTLCSEQDREEDRDAAGAGETADCDTTTRFVLGGDCFGGTRCESRGVLGQSRFADGESSFAQGGSALARGESSGSQSSQAWNWAWVWGPGMAMIPLVCLVARRDVIDGPTHQMTTGSDARTFAERTTRELRMLTNTETSRSEYASWYPHEPQIGRPVSCRDSRWPAEFELSGATPALRVIGEGVGASGTNGHSTSRGQTSQRGSIQQEQVRRTNQFTENAGGSDYGDDVEMGLLEDANAMILEMDRGKRSASSDRVPTKQGSRSEAVTGRGYEQDYDGQDYDGPGRDPYAENLTEICGIDRSFERQLNEIGIKNFSDLADANPEEIRGAFAARGGRFRNVEPAIWQHQAREILQGVS